jgi:hypothetical protein
LLIRLKADMREEHRQVEVDGFVKTRKRS